jgi:hypothetical protein
MALLALFPLVMIGVLLMVFTMIMDDTHNAHHDYPVIPSQSYDEDSIAA